MRGTDDQTAFAVPRLALGSTAEVALPQPLAPSEAARIRKIFALQAKGDITDAARDTAQLDSHLLLGAILADRYLGGWAHPTAAELTDWLAHYGDQPEALEIRALRARIAPDTLETTAPAIPIVSFFRPERSSRHRPAIASPTAARALFVQNRDAAAVTATEPLLSRPASLPGSGEALFAGGLAAWRLDDVSAALTFFEAAWRAAANAPARAAAAFWGARAAQRQADRSTSIVWLRRAAAEHDSFYGRIAARTLRPSSACTPLATLGPADLAALAATPAGRRAFALLQIGQMRRAEAEFRLLWADAGENAALAQTLRLVARAVGLTGLSTELQGAVYAAPRGPAPPPLQPAGGFVVDPPLVYALVHHESDFHAGAVSRDGAVGLMQIKPASAWTVSGARSLAGMRTARLHDPAVNLAIGQGYLLQLASDDVIDGDLIRLLAAYKQGPFELRRWADRVNAAGDPLLFLEAMPNAATRAFVEDVLAWSWHYAAVMHLPVPSLDALAAGRFPRLDRESREAATGTACDMMAATR
ncbi:MAG TPA: transglycosylase SLT domain-containing protein [Acetobacteraceae bacterium]|nr:transglycosylase SLT domain-containing protein [Acetobacteraceae bacterium]